MATTPAPAEQLRAPGTPVVKAPERLKFSDLSPEVVRTVIATRHLVIGVGGMGKEALTAMAYSMGERGMKFGVPHIEKVGDELVGVVVDGIEIDSNAKTFDVKDDGARALAESGVQACRLNLPGQDIAFRKAGIYDRCTPTWPDKDDDVGCNATPKVGLARYAILRQGKAKNDLKQYINPKALIQDTILSWKNNPNGPRRGNTYYVDVVAGRAGGTGPIATAVIADTIKQIEMILGEEANVMVRLFSISGESIGLGAPEDDGQQAKRDANSLVQTLYLNKQTHEGGVTLPDGEWLPGRPREIFLIDGQSTSVCVPKGGFNQPAYLAAKFIFAEILGDGGSVSQSAMSNIGADQKLIKLVRPGSTDGKKQLRRFSALGACETVSKPAPVTLERDKRKYLLARAAGLVDLDAAQIERVATLLQKVLPTELVAKFMDAVEVPTLNEDQVIMRGQEGDTGSRIDGVEQTFMASKVAPLRGEVEGTITATLDVAVKRLTDIAAQLLKEEGIGTETAFLDALTTALDTLESTCGTQKGLLGSSLKQDLMPGVAGLKVAVKEKSDIPSKFNVLAMIGGRDSALRMLRESVGSFVTHMNTIASTNRDFRVYDILVKTYIPALRQVLDDAQQANRVRKEGATGVLTGIKEAYDPSKSGTTAMDYPINVTPVWRENPTKLRESLDTFSADELRGLVDSIKLTPADTRLLDGFDQRTADAIGQWTEPFFRPSAFYEDLEEDPKGKVPVFAVPSEYVEVDEKGKIIQRKIPKPPGYDVASVKDSNRVVAFKQLHGLDTLEFGYLLEAYKRVILKLTPEDRDDFFTAKNDMKEMLYPYASDVAKRELERDKRGSIKDCTKCELPFYRSESKKHEECCPGCSKPSARR